MTRHWSTRSLFVYSGFAVIAGFLLLTEHRAHVFGMLPFAFLLACPLLHVLMHGGHHTHSAHRSPTDRQNHPDANGGNCHDGAGDAAAERNRAAARNGFDSGREVGR